MIYYTGDIHGSAKGIVAFAQHYELTESDIIVILGDVGANYYGNRRDRYCKDALAKIKPTVFCVHGNHERRPDTLAGYKQKEWNGGLVWYEDEYPNLLFARDGDIFTMEGTRHLVIGGAYSVDKYYRLENDLLWFADEQPSAEIKTNAKMLLGNHELMMMNALYYPPPEDEEWPEYYYERKQSLWYRNGGEITHNYLKHIKKTVRQEIFEYLEKLPVNMEITVNGRQFILTHAAPAELYETYGRKYECERDFAVWMRFDSFPVLENCTVIFGHTPTIRFQYDNPMAIWDAKSWIGIDCGCMLPEKGDPWSGALGRLSCLRLDDMQVFYSEEPQYDNLKESEEQHYG